MNFLKKDKKKTHHTQLRSPVQVHQTKLLDLTLPVRCIPTSPPSRRHSELSTNHNNPTGTQTGAITSHHAGVDPYTDI